MDDEEFMKALKEAYEAGHSDANNGIPEDDGWDDYVEQLTEKWSSEG